MRGSEQSGGACPPTSFFPPPPCGLAGLHQPLPCGMWFAWPQAPLLGPREAPPTATAPNKGPAGREVGAARLASGSGLLGSPPGLSSSKEGADGGRAGLSSLAP